MSETGPRIYLTGHVALEYSGRIITADALPGRQGRLAFAFLVANRFRPVTRGEIEDVLWPDGAPPEVDAAVAAILSKLRSMLKSAQLAAPAAIEARSGTIGLRLPSGTWVDIETAANALDEAEGALRAGKAHAAWGFANVVVSIARRPFLPDHEGAWVASQRGALRSILIRGLECLSASSEAAGQGVLAVDYASQVLDLEPYREPGYQRLMQLHAAMGNRAEALRVFERCRQLMRDELGASPSPRTEEIFLDILRAGS